MLRHSSGRTSSVTDEGLQEADKANGSDTFKEVITDVAKSKLRRSNVNICKSLFHH